jgi:hypothetical protein
MMLCAGLGIVGKSLLVDDPIHRWLVGILLLSVSNCLSSRVTVTNPWKSWKSVTVTAVFIYSDTFLAVFL